MFLHVITPEKTILETEVTRVTLPGELGEMEIFPGHTLLLSTLVSGSIKYSTPDTVKEININGGLVEVLGDRVTAML